MVIGDFLLNRLTYQGGAGEGKINLPTHRPFFEVLNMFARSQNPLLFSRGKKRKNTNKPNNYKREVNSLNEKLGQGMRDRLPPPINSPKRLYIFIPRAEYSRTLRVFVRLERSIERLSFFFF